MALAPSAENGNGLSVDAREAALSAGTTLLATALYAIGKRLSRSDRIWLGIALLAVGGIPLLLLITTSGPVEALWFGLTVPPIGSGTLLMLEP